MPWPSAGTKSRGCEGVGQGYHYGQEKDHDEHEDGVGVGEAGSKTVGRKGYGQGSENGEDGGYEQQGAFVPCVNGYPGVYPWHCQVTVFENVLEFEVIGQEGGYQAEGRKPAELGPQGRWRFVHFP